jgi:hypothetical protein
VLCLFAVIKAGDKITVNTSPKAKGNMNIKGMHTDIVADQSKADSGKKY